MKANGKEPEILSIKQQQQTDSNNDDVDNSLEKVEPHRDEGQVRLDVIRSFVHYPNGT